MKIVVATSLNRVVAGHKLAGVLTAIGASKGIKKLIAASKRGKPFMVQVKRTVWTIWENVDLPSEKSTKSIRGFLGYKK